MATPSSLISVRVSLIIAELLEKLAKSEDRPKPYLAAEAIEEYLEIHEWQVQAIQEGLEQIEQNDVLDFAEVKKQRLE